MAIEAGFLDSITLEFLHNLKAQAGMLQQAGKNLFYYLAVIQLTLSMLWMTLAGESLTSFLSKLVQLVFTLSFFYALIVHGGHWIPDLLNGFIGLGKKAGVTALSPSSIISQGMSISGAIMKGFGGWGMMKHPFVSMAGLVLFFAIPIFYTLIAVELVIILVKSYIIISLSGLFFAFGANDYTREMSKTYLKSAIGLSFKLMTLYFLIGVGQHLGHDWASMTAKAADQHELMPMLMILSGVILYYMIVKNVPPFVAGFSGVGGFKNYGEATAMLAINNAMKGANMVKNAGNMAGNAGKGLGQLGSASGKIAQLAGQQGKMGATGSAMSAVGGALKNSILSQNSHQSFGQKVNQHLANKIKPQK